MYAIVDYRGNQILLKEGTKTRIPYTKECKVGSVIKFENVLFYDDGKKKHSGNPFIKNINFEGKILSHERDSKVVVFKQKRRKGYQKKNGYKDDFTIVQINKLAGKTAAKTTAKKTTTKKTTAKKTTAKKSTSTKKTKE